MKENSANMPLVVDLEGLAEMLKAEKSTLQSRGQWRDYPHFFIYQGHNAKGARFDVEDVLAYLKATRGNNYVCGSIPYQEGEEIPRFSMDSEHEGNKPGGLSDEERRKGVGNRKRKEIRDIKDKGRHGL